ncbi:uncharacterized protein LOC141651839 [Silene latifolia]|uniref:uncharacterized protein LOC141651839 n=1 Tax=Silene latifolia TaxID=37657 RepID=UPI003D787DBC
MGLIEGLEVGKDKVLLSHLQFADDTLIFCPAKSQVLTNIWRLLGNFQRSSGLAINFMKSTLLVIGRNQHWGEGNALKMGCHVLQLPVKYLGIPLGSNPNKISTWDPVVDKVEKRLVSWKIELISKAGRVILIKSVLNSLPLFYMSIFQIPKGVLNQIINLQRRFYWGNNIGRDVVPLINWNIIQLPKEMGGVGIGDLQIKYASLLFKWWWRFHRNIKPCGKEFYVQFMSFTLMEYLEVKARRLGMGYGSRYALLMAGISTLKNSRNKVSSYRLFKLSVQKNSSIADMGDWNGDDWICLLKDDSPSPEVSDVVAFALPNASRTPTDWKALRGKEKVERRKLFCPHCEVNGHDIKGCFFKLNKFPDWWGSRPRNLADFRRSRAAGASASAGTGSSGEGLVHANALHTISSDRLSGMYASWIIDTGASNHVTGDFSLFTESMVIPPRAVGLPNGKRILASKMGTVHIDSNIVLRRVLFVPHLTCNLISVSQLTEDTDYVLQFTKDRCLIQDHTLRKMIGVGELRDGLFLLSSASVHSVNMLASYDLWHQRLGHPGANVVSHLPLAKSISVNKNLACDKGWKVYDIETDSILVSRDVVFYENIFLFPKLNAPTITTAPIQFPSDELPSEEFVSVDEPIVTEPIATEPIASEPANTTPESPPVSAPISDLGRGQRLKFPNSRLSGYVLDSINSPSPPDSPTSPSSSSGTPYTLANYVTCHKFSSRHKQFLAAITTSVEPTSFKMAMQDDGWCQAMQEEIDALEQNGTWDLAELPPNKKALGCRWVYKIKYKSDDSIERLKARLVVFGNHQVEGIDYGETFAPVVKMVTIRTFLAVAAIKNWELHQMDVHNAFLHGDITEEVYMKLPPGFSRGHDGKVCRLKKSLYGLRQAPRCWFAKLAGALRKYGFRQSYSDYSLFTYSSNTVCLHVLIYVDDLVIAGNDSIAISRFKDYLNRCFKMKDLGPLKYFLGLEVARNAEGIFLTQRKYCLDIITETGLLGSKPSSTPMATDHKLGLSTSPFLDKPESYRRLIGRLVYLAVTRPDLSFSVHVLSQFLQQPREAHMEAALRVVRYLKGSPEQGVLLRSASSLTVSGWCDSDFGACPLTRRSVTGWFVFLGDSPVSWKTKKQYTVSLSSSEAEYRSMATLVCELKWLKGLLASLDVPISVPMQLFCDNQSALHLSQNPVFHERTKHIEIDCHFVRDAITGGIVVPAHVPTDAQIADIFTKPLGDRQFHTLLRKLGIIDLHAPV